MKKLLLRVLLALASALGALLLAELAMQLAVTRLPRQAFAHQGREWRTLAQSSKFGLAPRGPWFAVLGDSYGEGLGDRLIEQGWNITSRHQATHGIHDITGVDVVSLSRAGAGNYDGPAIFAVNTLRFLRREGFEIPAPATVLVYFYEGNDVADDLRFVERHWDPRPREDLFDDEAFARFEAEIDARFCRGVLPRWHERWLAANLLARALDGRLYAWRHADEVPFVPGSRFLARMGGGLVALPDQLDGDVLDFSEAELAIAERLFDRGLRRVGELFPDARRLVVYICAINTTYELTDELAGARMERSRAVQARVEAAARAQGCEFVDASATLRAAARERFLHGPRDWGHLNGAGYDVLAATIVRALARPGGGGSG